LIFLRPIRGRFCEPPIDFAAMNQGRSARRAALCGGTPSPPQAAKTVRAISRIEHLTRGLNGQSIVLWRVCWYPLFLCSLIKYNKLMVIEATMIFQT
jgi:hypothetical protein